MAPKETRSFKHTGSYLIENKTPVAYRHFFTEFKVFIQKLLPYAFPSNVLGIFHWQES